MPACDIRYQIFLDGRPNQELTDSASSITVKESMRELTTFEIELSVDVEPDGTIPFVDDDDLEPGRDNTISVVITIDGESSVISHGVLTRRDVQLVHGGPGSSVKLMGADRRTLLDRNTKREQKYRGKIGESVRGILARGEYPFNDGELDIEQVEGERYAKGSELVQNGSDLALIRKLAGDVGVEFWVDWELKRRADKQVVETVHFKAEPTRNEGATLGGFSAPIPLFQASRGPELTLNNGDPKGNSLLQFSTKRFTEIPKSSGKIERVNIARGKIESSSVPAPTQQPLGEELTTPPGHEASVVSSGGIENAVAKTRAALNDVSWAVTGNASTTAYALGGALVRPRQVVTVKGAGPRDNGEYLVWSVDHKINQADHEISMELRRNAEGG